MRKQVRISLIGAGYVGLTTAVGFSKKGFKTILMDIDKEKVERINSGESPIYEPGLREMLKELRREGNIEATTNLDYAVSESEITFICVPTPSRRNGDTDLRYIEDSSKAIGKALRLKEHYHVVAVKSTVPPETTERVVIPNLEEGSGKKAGPGFGVCMNPEFLREGSALEDFLNPDRIVIGELDPRSGETLAFLYRGFAAPVLRTSLKVAEMIKYASNSFLAMKITYANEIGNICKKLGIDAYEVMKGVGLDSRISPHFLRAGIGFGGSCFPKDVLALVSKAEKLGYNASLLKEVINVNSRQPYRMIDLLKKRIGSLKGKRIAVLGLAFKPETDDVRESPALRIVSELIRQGAGVVAYDPKAMFNFRKAFPKIGYAESAKEALKGADACLVVTEWREFRDLTDDDFSAMRGSVIIEGRRALDPKKVDGFEGVCW